MTIASNQNSWLSKNYSYPSFESGSINVIYMQLFSFSIHDFTCFKVAFFTYQNFFCLIYFQMYRLFSEKVSFCSFFYKLFNLKLTLIWIIKWLTNFYYI